MEFLILFCFFYIDPKFYVSRLISTGFGIAYLHDWILGVGISKPETDLVTLGPDADDRPVDHTPGVLEALSDQAEQNVEP